MRRADRLFQIIQALRRSRRPVTANQLAAELEVSRRTVYRDIADLIGQRVPIRGEAGIGYVLDRSFDIPPLMFTTDELEAAVLGAQWVANRGDGVLACAARDLISKILLVLPERLRPFIAEPSVGVPTNQAAAADGLDITLTRSWIRGGRKIRIRYTDERSRETERTIWLADDHWIRRDGATPSRLVRASTWFSSFQDRPYRGC
jgi:predicted DNA-binding transcriptional regulator YafY